MKRFLRDNGLSLALFSLFFACQIVLTISGHLTHNSEQQEHGQPTLTYTEYLHSSDYVEATVENWESEFLQMTAFVTLTAILHQKGSPESRRPGAIEAVDADPRDFAHLDDAPWPVKHGGWVLRVYEHSLGLALFGLFAISWIGHVIGGWAANRHTQQLHNSSTSTIVDYLTSSQFWFESFQNWQSEFLSVAVMVWLAVYLRQRGSPESKPVHAAHSETGR